jgi:hypothetical protein|tara:strand:- start:180 stop:380 length:201 start_codon:yes stop_codon:yes gene_type:complete
MSKDKIKAPSRRDFIKSAGMGVGIAAVASGVLSSGKVNAASNPKNEKTIGYHETDHIKKYYDSAKF